MSSISVNRWRIPIRRQLAKLYDKLEEKADRTVLEGCVRSMRWMVQQNLKRTSNVLPQNSPTTTTIPARRSFPTKQHTNKDNALHLNVQLYPILLMAPISMFSSTFSSIFLFSVIFLFRPFYCLVHPTINSRHHYPWRIADTLKKYT